MGSYYMNIYKCNHSKIKESFSDNFLNQIGSGLTPDEMVVMKNLLTKNYTRDAQTLESADAPELIYCLELVCKKLATDTKNVEFYPDEDKLPELHLFPFDDWDVNDDFELPLSPYGTPSVVYRNKKSLLGYLEKFKKMKDEGTFDSNYIAEEDLQNLISIVSDTITEDTGVFIFCSQ